MLKQFAKASLDAAPDVELSEMAAEAHGRVTHSVPQLGTGDLLWSLPCRLSRYRCIARGLLSFLGSLWQNA